MGINSEANDLISAAFDSDLSDAVSSFVLRQYNRGQYDTSTGLSSGGASPTEITSRGVFSNYDQREVLNSAIEPLDQRLIVLQSELSLVPKIGDTVIKSDDLKEYRVHMIVEDPANVIWELQVRAVQ